MKKPTAVGGLPGENPPAAPSMGMDMATLRLAWMVTGFPCAMRALRQLQEQEEISLCPAD